MLISLTTKAERSFTDEEYLATLVQEFLADLRFNNLASPESVTEISVAVGANKKRLRKIYRQLGSTKFEEIRKEFFERPLTKDKVSLM